MAKMQSVCPTISPVSGLARWTMLRCFSRNSGTNFRRTFFEAAAILCIAVDSGSNLNSATGLQLGRLHFLYIHLVVVRASHFLVSWPRAHEENWRAVSDSGE